MTSYPYSMPIFGFVALDSSGNIYTVEYNLNAGPPGEIEYYCIKYDSGGDYVGQFYLDFPGQFFGSTKTSVLGFDINANNDLYFIVSFKPISTSYFEYFLARYNTAGTRQWYKTITPAAQTGTGDAAGYNALDSENDLWCWEQDATIPQDYLVKYDMAQTEFLAYTSPTAGTTFGTPDGGVAIPGLEALSAAGLDAIVADQHMIDVRNRIEALAPWYVNVITGNPFNWTGASADNLFYVSMGGGYDWTIANDDLAGSPTYDIDINEARQCLDTLLASTLV